MRTLLDLITGLSLANDHGRGEWMADATAVAPGDTVLDIGCGPGTGLQAAMQRGAAVIGLDPSPTMLWLAARRVPGAVLLAAAVDAIPLPCDSVNVAWASGSLHHWPDVDAGLTEVRRVLAPGGRLLIIERSGSGHGVRGSHAINPTQAEGLVEQLSRAGFVDAAVATPRIGKSEMLVVRANAPAEISSSMT
jgi:ubiquinone/menaquinone biosynthesis C-methylase UbiE